MLTTGACVGDGDCSWACACVGAGVCASIATGAAADDPILVLTPGPATAAVVIDAGFPSGADGFSFHSLALARRVDVFFAPPPPVFVTRTARGGCDVTPVAWPDDIAGMKGGSLEDTVFFAVPSVLLAGTSPSPTEGLDAGVDTGGVSATGDAFFGDGEGAGAVFSGITVREEATSGFGWLSFLSGGVDLKDTVG